MTASRKLEILLIDDRLEDVFIVKKLLLELANGGHLNIHALRDGQQAIDYLSNCLTFDVVILDLNLPIISGIEVLEFIRGNEDERIKYLPVIILSTSDNSDIIATAYRMGASAYLVKPLQYDKFKTIMSAFASFWLNAASLLKV